MSVIGEVLKISSDLSNMGDFLKNAMVSSTYADVILCCRGGQRFSAHRLVLSAASPYLEKVLLTHEMQAGQSEPITVILAEVESTDLEALLGFVYTGNTVVSRERLETFSRTAAALEIKIPPIPYSLTLSQAENYLSGSIPVANDGMDTYKRHCDHSCLDYSGEINMTKGPFAGEHRFERRAYQRPVFPIELFENYGLNLKKNNSGNHGAQEERRQRQVANHVSASPWCQITRPHHLPRIQPMILRNNEKFSKDFIQAHVPVTSSIKENESRSLRDEVNSVRPSNGNSHQFQDQKELPRAPRESLLKTCLQKSPEKLSETGTIHESAINKCTSQSIQATSTVNYPKILEDDRIDMSLRESSIKLSIQSAKLNSTNGSEVDEDIHNNNNSMDKVRDGIGMDEDQYKSNLSNKSFENKASLKVHAKKRSGEKPFRCGDCGREFSQLRNFRYHRSIHDKTGEFSATCLECGKSFNDRGYLGSHMKIHRNRKEYTCQECGRSFNQRVAYNMHVRIHSGIKPHHCDECGKAFSRKMLLKQHFRTHTGERPYKCHICHKAFADRSNMTLHIRLHSGLKPYQCEVCTKAFTKKHHLKTHLNYHYGVKPYSCPNCSLAFSQSSNMRTHLKKCSSQNKSGEKHNNSDDK